MTSSAKQTESKTSESTSDKAERTGALPEMLSRHPTVLLGGVLLLTGWIFSLQINGWHFGVPVFMLWLGWAGVLGTVRFLWVAGLAASEDLDDDDVPELDIDSARRQDLESEKQGLLRAIKEIEFDRDLGKMSEKDATEIMGVYRVRAIEIIKELDGKGGADLSVPDRIERELKARLAVIPASKKKAVKKAAQVKSSDGKNSDAKSDDTKKATQAKSEDADKADAKSDDAEADEADEEAKSTAASEDARAADEADSESAQAKGADDEDAVDDEDDEDDTAQPIEMDTSRDAGRESAAELALAKRDAARAAMDDAS